MERIPLETTPSLERMVERFAEDRDSVSGEVGQIQWGQGRPSDSKLKNPRLLALWKNGAKVII